MLALATLGSVAARTEEGAVLRFARHGVPVATLDRAALARVAPLQVVQVFEPYEQDVARFDALPLVPLLDHVFGRSWRGEEELLFTCRDGYQPTVPVRRVLDHRAWLALDRRGEAGFAIDKHESGRVQRIDLSPAYLVWENLDDAVIRQQGDYGWPYQLVGIELIRARDRFPEMAPPATAPASVQAGFRAFRIHCSRCHPMNGQGGAIGPELNGPEAGVRVRDDAWLLRWITDPGSLLPTARMEPLNPALPDRDLVAEQILAYLHAMADARPAPGARPAEAD